jgi:hypothetical protein
MFILSLDKNGARIVTPNEAFRLWKKDILELQAKIDHQIKAVS